MKAILIDAVAVGNATARALTFAPRDERTEVLPGPAVVHDFYAGGYAFEDSGERILDARAMFHYYATGITPAMTKAKPGTGSTYAIAARDSQGRLLRRCQDLQGHAAGAGSCRPLLVVHDLRQPDRSMLETDQKLAGLDSTLPDLKKNADGSVTVYFAPKAPAGQEGNWVQTWSGQGLERPAAAVRADRALVQQDLEARRLRVGELS